MKKFSLLFMLLLIAANVQAGVRMLGDPGTGGNSRRSFSSGVSFKSQTSSSTYKASSGREWCIANGYPETTCEAGDVMVTCPRNSRYVHCCPPKYRFRKEFCESRGYIPSEDDCMGYYRCMLPPPVSSQEEK